MRTLLARARRLIGSRTASVALRTLLGPFRLLVLTPLVLLKLDPAEQDAYFFLFAAWIAGAVFGGAIDSMFTRRMAIAIERERRAGADGIHEPRPGNVTVLSEDSARLFSLERWVCVFVTPLVIGLMLATLISGRNLDHAADFNPGFYVAFLLIVADSVVNLVTLRYFSALSAIGRIRESSYIQAATSLVTFLGGAIALLLGGKLIAFFATLVILALVSRPFIIRYFHRVATCHHAPIAIGCAFSETRKLSPVLLREAAFLLLPALSGRGMTLFLAGRFEAGLLASIAVSISVASLAVEFAASIIMSQIPRFASLLKHDAENQLLPEIRNRLIFVVIAGLIGVVGGGFMAQRFLMFVGSETNLLEWRYFLIVGAGLVLARTCALAIKVFHCTDQLSFLPSSIIANALSVAMFLVGGLTGNLLMVCLGVGWPLAMVINRRPLTALRSGRQPAPTAR